MSLDNHQFEKETNELENALRFYESHSRIFPDAEYVPELGEIIRTIPDLRKYIRGLNDSALEGQEAIIETEIYSPDGEEMKYALYWFGGECIRWTLS